MKKRWMAVYAGLLLFSVLAGPAAAMEVTIVGRVTDSHAIITDDGEVYEVAMNDLGDELLLEHDGKKVEVKGTLEQDDELKVLVVLAYFVLDE